MGSSSSILDPKKDLVDLHGKVAIVTGGNAGIGFWTVVHLSRRGAKVYIASRNESKVTGAIARMKDLDSTPDHGEVLFHKLSLDDPREAKKSAEAFLSRESRLDILVNNAGQQSCPFEKTKDGVVNTMAINHISPFVFTNELSPLLEKTAAEPDSDVRIVNVSSLLHSMPKKATFDSLDAFNETYEKAWLPPPNMMRYAHSKLANVLWTNELQRRYDAKGVNISCITIHPGGVLTDTALAQIRERPMSGLLLAVSKLFSDEPEQGSFTTVFAAASKTIRENPKAYHGKYLAPYGKIVEASGQARDPKLAQTLWETTEKLLKDIYGM